MKQFILGAMGLAAMASASAARAQGIGGIALDHVALYVENVDRSAEFYKAVFGLAEVKAPVPIARWLLMKNGTALHIVSGRKMALENTKWDHFALACVDMDAMIAKLDGAKIRWSDISGKRAVQVRGDGVKQIFIRDPDGYWIEINDAGKGG